MIDLQQQYLDQVIAILKANVPDYEVWAFGSRVNGKAQKYSDLDLVLVGDQALDWRRMEALKDNFSESDLPIIVDVVDWCLLSDSFKKNILAKYEVIK
ncbi:MAG: nucleotidyltransferase family protein [Gammaproteobacteria bacterium]